MMDQKHKGAYAEQRAIVWLMERGYEVFTNVSQHGSVDLIARSAGTIILIDVTTGHWRDYKSGRYLSYKKFTDPAVKGLVMDPDGGFWWAEVGQGQSIPPERIRTAQETRSEGTR